MNKNIGELIKQKRTETVSYTHLDVYKRQVKDVWWNDRGIGTFIKM